MSKACIRDASGNLNCCQLSVFATLKVPPTEEEEAAGHHS